MEEDQREPDLPPPPTVWADEPAEQGPPSHRGRIAAITITALLVVGAAVVRFAVRETTRETLGPGGAAQTMIVDEGFDGTPDGWLVQDDDLVRFGPEGGAYVMYVRDPSYLAVSAHYLRDRTWDAVVVEASVSQPEDAPRSLVGVGCEAEQDRGYHFLVEPRSARYVILRSSSKEEFETIAGGTDHALLVHPSPTGTTLAGECVHDPETGTTHLRFFVDDQLLMAYDDAEGWSSYRGMSFALSTVGDPDARAAFDDARMARIDEASPASDVYAAATGMEEPRLVSAEVVSGFGNAARGPFGTQHGKGYAFEYVEGEYQIVVGREDSWRRWSRWFETSHDAVVVAVSARKASVDGGEGRFGVYCLAERDVDDLYGFLVDPDDGSYAIWRLEDDRFESTLVEGDSPFVGFGTGSSAIRGDCISEGRTTTLRMYVNGYLIAETADGHGFGAFRGVGVVAQSVDPGVDVRFDRVVYGGIRP